MTRLQLAPLALAAGIAVAMQSASNSGLRAYTGLGPALLVNTTIVMIGSLMLWLGMGAKTTFFSVGAPWTLYIGGLCGFVIIATLAYVFPRLGAAWGVALLVLGQCAAALVIDQYGMLGMPREPITAHRMLGMVLVVAGVSIVRW